MKLMYVKSEANDAHVWTKNNEQESFGRHVYKHMRKMISTKNTIGITRLKMGRKIFCSN